MCKLIVSEQFGSCPWCDYRKVFTVHSSLCRFSSLTSFCCMYMRSRGDRAVGEHSDKKDGEDIRFDMHVTQGTTWWDRPHVGGM